MSKRSSLGIVIGRSNPQIDDSFAKELEQQLNKNSVNSVNRDKEIYNQILSIVGNKKSKFSSVDAAVKDMQERSGFSSFLKKKSDKVKNQKIASLEITQPTLFQEYPHILQTFINCIDDNDGTLSTPALLERVKRIHNREVVDNSLWDDPALIIYVSKQNLDKRKSREDFNSQHSGLGKNYYHTNEQNEDDDLFQLCDENKIK